LKDIKIGIIAAPELPTYIANNLKEKLPKKFGKWIRDDVSWHIEVVTDALTAIAEGRDELIDEAILRKKNRDWNYTICLTDLPIYYEKKVVLADVDFDSSVSVLSIPAFGWFSKNRIIKMILKVVENIYYKNPGNVIKKQQSKTYGFHPLVNKVQKIRMDENNKVDVRYLLYPKVNGQLRLLAGMTFANQPWQIVPSFRSVLGIAFGTGSYGLIFPSLWQVSYEYGPLRLMALMFLAIMSMTIWIIQGHNLWESNTERNSKKMRRLYNATTASTLLIAVTFFYIALMLLFFIVTLVFVAPDFYGEQVSASGSVGLIHYMKLAWVVISVATMAGAIGVGLENEENVRNSTYGYRQQKRYQEMEDAKKKEEEKQEKDDDETEATEEEEQEKDDGKDEIKENRESQKG